MRIGDTTGAALIDIIVATSLCVVMAAIAVPVIGGTLERERTIVGAHFSPHICSARGWSRSSARDRSRCVSKIVGDRTQLRLFADGNGNGVLQRDIDRGIDPPLTPCRWLDDQARDISLRVNQTVTDVAGNATIAPGDDPLRIGNTAILTFSPVAVPPAARCMSRLIGDHRWRFGYSERPAVSAC